MSRRRSTGDLVPWDVTEVLVKEARAQRSQRKTGSSLGLAFNWLKGSRRKKNVGNGHYRNDVGVIDGKLATKNHGKAGPKGNEDQRRLTVHFTSSQHYQKNVFIEGSRPDFLEDLHIEAQEGLKVLQQEENKAGVTTVDDESIASADIPEPDICSEDNAASPECTIASGDDESPTRPALSRQGEELGELNFSGSTFRPLNPVKRHEKIRRRNRRTTIMGIPNQVQKELALHRHSTFQQLPHHDNGRAGVLALPTGDGGTPLTNQEGARVHLSDLEVDSHEDDILKRHLQVVYRDDAITNHRASSVLRPKSVAVPGMLSSSSFSSSMFSFLQEPQGPVMSISPQATYLSTIIPNAVLPASVDVIEIDCSSSSRTLSNTAGHGRSVRTVSKGSLASLDSSLSPVLVRKLDVDGSQTDNSQNSTTISPSPSHSDWSESQSSRTVVLNSSPMSSKSSERGGKPQEGLDQECCVNQDVISLQSAVSIISSPCSPADKTFAGDESEASLTVADRDNASPKRRCSRSLSIVKTKQPPAPPQRTHSLHSSRIRVDVRDPGDGEHLNGSSSTAQETSTGNVVVTESVGEESVKTPGRVSTSCSCAFTQQSTEEARKAAGPQPQRHNHSPPTIPSEMGKFERTLSPSSGYSSQSGTPTLSPRETSPTSPDKQRQMLVKPENSTLASPSSSLTSLSSEVSSCCLHTPAQELVPDAAAEEHKTILRLEVRELLHIPAPPRVKAPCPPPPETWVHNRRTFELLCGPSPDLHTVHIHTRPCKQAGTQTDLCEVAASDRQDPKDNAAETSDDVKLRLLTVVPEEVPFKSSPKEGFQGVKEQSDREEIPVKIDKTDPPAVMSPVASLVVSSTVDLDPLVEKCPSSMEDKDSGVHLKTKVLQEESPATSKEGPPKFSLQSSAPTDQHIPWQASSPPAPVEQVQEVVHAVESSWPPPPPPLEGLFDGTYESDFPPPPPPLMAESVLQVMDSCCPAFDEVSASNKEWSEGQTSPAPDPPSAQLKSDVEARATEYVDTFPEDLQNALSSLDIDQLTTSPQDYPLSVIAFPSLSSTSVLQNQDLTPCEQSTVQKVNSTQVPLAPPLPVDTVTPGVSFRRQPNGVTKDNKTKEILGRPKSIPTPKEDANIPLVTPSLLQMVRLRSVSMSEDQLRASEAKPVSEATVPQERCQSVDPGPQAVPQKPIRKSLSLKAPQMLKASTPTSMRLQEAIRMKTAAMSSRDSLPCRITTRPLTYSNIPETDSRRTPASTASFILSKGTKTVVTSTSAPEDQACLKQSLVSELMHLSGQSGAFFYGAAKEGRVPPPVAKKPQVQSNSSSLLKIGVNGSSGGGQRQKEPTHRLESTTTRVTADTIETLF